MNNAPCVAGGQEGELARAGCSAAHDALSMGRTMELSSCSALSPRYVKASCCAVMYSTSALNAARSCAALSPARTTATVIPRNSNALPILRRRGTCTLESREAVMAEPARQELPRP